MEFTSFQCQALIEDPGVNGQGLNGTDLIGVKRDFTELSEALQLLCMLNNNPMTSILQFMGVTETGDLVNLYTKGVEIEIAESHQGLKDIISGAVNCTDVPTGYRVVYTDRHDDVVERRGRFFDTEEQVRAFATEYYDLENSYYGINHGFCRPEQLQVAVGPKAWDMTMCLYDQEWEVSFPEDCYLDSFEITDPHKGKFEYGNIRRTHCVTGELNDDGTISIPLSVL